MNRGRLRQTVREAHLQHVAHPRLDGGAGHLAVEAPGARLQPRHELPLGLARLQVYANDLASPLRLGGLVCESVGGAPVLGRSMLHGTVAALVMGMLV